MNVLKRRALILALLVLCLIGMTILGASAAVDTTTATTTQTADSVASATVKVGDAAPALYYYTDLATAIAEADENTTVTLLKDVTISAEIAVEKALTIDGDGHIHLTDSGLAVAEKILSRHELLTTLLVELGVNRETAAADACKMEHVISDETYEAIRNYVNLCKNRSSG